MCLKKFFKTYIKVLTLKEGTNRKEKKRNTKIINKKTEFENKVIKKPTAQAW